MKRKRHTSGRIVRISCFTMRMRAACCLSFQETAISLPGGMICSFRPCMCAPLPNIGLYATGSGGRRATRAHLHMERVSGGAGTSMVL